MRREVERPIELPAGITHDSIEPKIRRERDISDTLIRLSVGIEVIEGFKVDCERGSFAAVFTNHSSIEHPRSTS